MVARAASCTRHFRAVEIETPSTVSTCPRLFAGRLRRVHRDPPPPAMSSTSHRFQGHCAMCDVPLLVLRLGPVSRPSEEAHQASSSDFSLSHPASSTTSFKISSNPFGGAESSSDSPATPSPPTSALASTIARSCCYLRAQQKKYAIERLP